MWGSWGAPAREKSFGAAGFTRLRIYPEEDHGKGVSPGKHRQREPNWVGPRGPLGAEKVEAMGGPRGW